MNETLSVSQEWSALHIRAARGETLSPEERAVYEAGLKQLEEGESYPGVLTLLKQARAQTAALEAEQAELRVRHDARKARIAVLEAALDERTRQALGLTAVAQSG